MDLPARPSTRPTVAVSTGLTLLLALSYLGLMSCVLPTVVVAVVSLFLLPTFCLLAVSTGLVLGGCSRTGKWLTREDVAFSMVMTVVLQEEKYEKKKVMI
jgi:uncharacterized membrane protein